MDSLQELEKLEPHLQRLAAKSRKKHARIDELRRELRKATNKAQKYDADCTKHIIYYSRNQCLHFANMMQQKLPAELRDLIYELLVVEDRPIPVGPYYHYRPYDQPIHNASDQEPEANLPSSPGPVTPWAVVKQRRRSEISDDYIEDGSETEDANSGLEQADSLVSPEIIERIRMLDLSWDNECTDIDDEKIILPDGRVKEVHTHKPPSDIVLPSSYLLNPRYFGPTMSTEIQKVYYAQNAFSICSLQQAIRSFGALHSGYFMQKWKDDGSPRKVPDDLKLQPLFYPKNHVRDLQVRVKYEQYHLEESQYPDAYGKYAYQQRFLRQTLSNIEKLDLFLGFSLPSEMRIEFVLMTKLPDIGDADYARYGICGYINFLQCIRNMVYKLMYDHNNVCVKVTHYDEDNFPFPRDLTGIFALTREQWEYEKSLREGPGANVDKFYLLAPWPGQENIVVPYGYHSDELGQYIRERWGLEEALDTKTTYPIREGRYWPRAIRLDARTG